MNFLKNLSVLIVGLGESGVACATFAHAAGARVYVVDTRSQPPAAALAAMQSLAGITLQLGELPTTIPDDIQTVVMSPGLSPHQPSISLLLTDAREKNIPVVSEIDWFYQAILELGTTHNYSPTILAITGTNGKTTVTELTTHLCNEASLTAIACGNISPSALLALHTAIVSDTLPAVWVLELSSFQLHYTQKFVAHAATVLNISQDHLDWHSDMAEYTADKARIFASSTVRILNRDDPSFINLNDKNSRCIGFGQSVPLIEGDVGCLDDGSLNWLAIAVDAQPDRKRRKHEPVQTQVQRLMPADALRIRGGHNHSNALAAMLLAQQAGVTLAQALGALRSYAGATHRCELVGIVNDVAYINDSKGTNVGATVAALEGLSEGHKRLILIAGGVAKGQDFASLHDPVARYCKAVYLIGRDMDNIAQALGNLNVVQAQTLEAAVSRASDTASAGDTVLLSPACASFDQFKNYAHRGQVFTALVNELASTAGAAL